MNKLIHESMLSAANSNPNTEAVRFGQQTLLYKELEHGSANIASYLNTLNLDQEQCIGLFMDKRIESILAIYGVMRSGAVYVPLDIKNPPSRIQYIIGQCSITTLFTTPEHIKQLVSIISGFDYLYNIVVLADENWNPPPSSYNVQYTILSPLRSDCFEPVAPDNKLVDENDLATILYTSGSTGTPKGVMITHSCVMTFTAWVKEYFKLNPDDRCISHAPLHFDLSLLDIFATHRAGACSVLIPEKIAANPRAITKLLAHEEITIWQSVPSVLVLLLKYGGIEKYQYNSLRHVLFAGEKMSANNLKGLSSHFGGSVFHNIYGSTETNDSFIYSVSASTDIFPDPLPIGQPLPYVDFLITDAKNPNAEHAREGELQIKTPTLMRGYKNNKQSWVMKDNNDIYYNTGDIVKTSDDGNIIFCGRTDDIVKSSGCRVNLLEIENVLQSHKDISNVAVIPFPDEEIGNKIIAIITAPTNNCLSIVDLKVFSAQRLPKYAIPHIFEISTNPIPKTSSGKNNKQTLIQSRRSHVTQA